MKDYTLEELEESLSSKRTLFLNAIMADDSDKMARVADPSFYKEPFFLHAAISSNKRNAVKALLTLGADVNAVTENGETGLHLATRNKNGGIVGDLLEHNANQSLPDKSGSFPLHIASSNRDQNTIDTLLAFINTRDINQRDKNDRTALYFLAQSYYTTASHLFFPRIKKLLDAGADLSIADNQGITPLMIFVNKYAFGADIDLTDLLLPKIGNCLNQRDKEGGTALHHAIRLPNRSVSCKIIEKLLTVGANPFIANKRGNTPFATLIEKRGLFDYNQAIIDLLLPLIFINNISPDLLNQDPVLRRSLWFAITDQTPLDVLRKLFIAGVDPSIKRYDGRALLEDPYNNSPNREVATLLSMAIKVKFIIDKLLSNNADFTTEDAEKISDFSHEKELFQGMLKTELMYSEKSLPTAYSGIEGNVNASELKAFVRDLLTSQEELLKQAMFIDRLIPAYHGMPHIDKEIILNCSEPEQEENLEYWSELKNDLLSQTGRTETEFVELGNLYRHPYHRIVFLENVIEDENFLLKFKELEKQGVPSNDMGIENNAELFLYTIQDLIYANESILLKKLTKFFDHLKTQLSVTHCNKVDYFEEWIKTKRIINKIFSDEKLTAAEEMYIDEHSFNEEIIDRLIQTNTFSNLTFEQFEKLSTRFQNVALKDKRIDSSNLKDDLETKDMQKTPTKDKYISVPRGNVFSIAKKENFSNKNTQEHTCTLS